MDLELAAIILDTGRMGSEWACPVNTQIRFATMLRPLRIKSLERVIM